MPARGFVIDRQLQPFVTFLKHYHERKLPLYSHQFDELAQQMTSPPYKDPHLRDHGEEGVVSLHEDYLDDMLFDVPSGISSGLGSAQGDSHGIGNGSAFESRFAHDSPLELGQGADYIDSIGAPSHASRSRRGSNIQHQSLATLQHSQEHSHMSSRGLPMGAPHPNLELSRQPNVNSSAMPTSMPLYGHARSNSANDTLANIPMRSGGPEPVDFTGLGQGQHWQSPGSGQTGGSVTRRPMTVPHAASNRLSQQRSPNAYHSPQGEAMHPLSPSQASSSETIDGRDEAKADAGPSQTGQTGQTRPPPQQQRPHPSPNQAQQQQQQQQQQPSEQQQNNQQQNVQSRPVEIQKTTEIKARACDECRRRKTACYYLKGNDAKCFRCQMEDVECTFSKRQGPQSGSSAGPGGTALAGSVVGGRQLPISQRAAAKHAAPNATSVQNAGPIEDYSQLPGRSLLKKSLSLQHPRSSFSVGQHGLWDQRVLESVALDKSGQARISANLSLRKVGNDSWFMVRNEGGHSDWIRDCDEIERTVYPYGRALVNSFFMFFHPEYPVLHERIFIEKYLRTYRELMPALLGAVYLLGMRWWYHSPELSTVARPHHVMPALYDLVIANFFKSSGGASLSLIQSGLLLLQCSYAETRHLSICSVINATAYRLALNRNCLHWKLPRWEINLRLRLSWATYSQSTWISLFESIPPLTQDSSWFLSLLNSDNFDSGTYEPAQGGALFIQLNKLSLIVHDIHNLLSSRLLLMYSSQTSAEQAVENNVNRNRWGIDTPGQFAPSHHAPAQNSDSSSTYDAGKPDSSVSGTKASSPKSTAPVLSETKSVEEILELIKPIQIRLRQWYSGLPTSLASIDGDKPSGNYSLRLAYIAAEVSLHRFIIRTVTSHLTSSPKNPELLQIVKSSARERLEVAASLIAALRPQHLQQFWYFASAYQFAVIGLFAALMYTTSDSQTDAEYYWNMLHNFVSQLQMYSDSDVISAALRMLRSSIAGVPGLAF